MIDPKIPICKFQKANVLFSLDRFKDALQVLEQLQKICPSEAAAHILHGKVYKKLDKPAEALKCF